MIKGVSVTGTGENLMVDRFFSCTILKMKYYF